MIEHFYSKLAPHVVGARDDTRWPPVLVNPTASGHGMYFGKPGWVAGEFAYWLIEQGTWLEHVPASEAGGVLIDQEDIDRDAALRRAIHDLTVPDAEPESPWETDDDSTPTTLSDVGPDGGYTAEDVGLRDGRVIDPIEMGPLPDADETAYPSDAPPLDLAAGDGTDQVEVVEVTVKKPAQRRARPTTRAGRGRGR